ncbi:PAS/PAC sensor protein [Planoprotostelium fungivorum]|uniref:PAS/PAC sensor protein n=1 Tax=Planoprotostelium fungivorum TaxID=1890364 RepID=A0A2P6NNC2_9EUKA|nr:PAS/PAC sensor protein [Planoprotostelium fungivorum]
MGQKISVDRIRQVKDAKGAAIYSTHFELVLLDVQNRAYEQYPSLEEGAHSCTVTDNSLEDNPIIWVNDEFERMTLFPRDEIVGHNCRFLQGPATNREAVTNIKKSIEAGKPVDVELLNYRKDGVAFWNNFKILPVWSRDRKIITHFIAVQNDVTVLKQPGRYWQQWSPAEVGGWLVKIDLGDFSKVFMQKNIPGKKIVEITDAQLREFGMTESEIEIYVSFPPSLPSKPWIQVHQKRELITGKALEPSASQSKKEISNADTIAIKCYLDGKAQIYTVSRKTPLNKFHKTLKREHKWEFTMRLASDSSPLSSTTWSKRLQKAHGTVVVFLTRTSHSNEKHSLEESMSASATSSQSSLSGGNALDLFNNNGGAQFESDENQFSSSMFLLNQSTFTEVMKLEGSNDSAELTGILYTLFDGRGRMKDIMQWATTFEINRIANINEFMRSQSMATRLMTLVVRSEPGVRYLWYVMQPTMKAVLAKQQNYTKDVKSLNGDDQLEYTQWMIATCQSLIDRLCDSVHMCPLSVRDVMSAIIAALDESTKVDCEPQEMGLIVCALRYLVPAFVDPSQFDAMVGILSEEQSKSLRQFSVLFQKVCNNSDYPEETASSQRINAFIQTARPKLLDYMRRLTDETTLETYRQVVRVSFTPPALDDVDAKLSAAVTALRVDSSNSNI